MSQLTLTSSPWQPDGPAADDSHVALASRAVRVRRWFLVGAPVLAGLLAVVGTLADPAVGRSGRELYDLYATHPGPLQVKSLALHWSYAFWMAPALLLAAHVRHRGSWLANVAALLGFAGMTTLPGLLFSDWYDSAIGQVAGTDAVVAVQERMTDTMWGVPVFTTPGIVGLLLALPLAVLAACLGRVLPWWSLGAAVGAEAAVTVAGFTWWGAAVTTAFFAALSFSFARGTRPQAV